MTEKYSISSDFGTVTPNIAQIDDIVQNDPGITTSLIGTIIHSDDVDIIFVSDISAPEKTALDSIVSSYSLNSNFGQTVKGTITVKDGTGKNNHQSPPAGNNLIIADSNESSGIRFFTLPGNFSAYDSAGEVDINSGFTAITWNTEDHKDSSHYTHEGGSSNITLNITRKYKITVDISTYVISGNNPTSTEARLVIDAGGGFTEMLGTKSFIFNRNSSTGHGTTSITKYYSATAGDIIRLEAQKLSGNNILATCPNGCRIIIENILC